MGVLTSLALLSLVLVWREVVGWQAVLVVLARLDFSNWGLILLRSAGMTVVLVQLVR